MGRLLRRLAEEFNENTMDYLLDKINPNDKKLRDTDYTQPNEVAIDYEMMDKNDNMSDKDIEKKEKETTNKWEEQFGNVETVLVGFINKDYLVKMNYKNDKGDTYFVYGTIIEIKTTKAGNRIVILQNDKGIRSYKIEGILVIYLRVHEDGSPRLYSEESSNKEDEKLVKKDNEQDLLNLSYK